MIKRSGVYVITNTVNGKRYVGSSSDVDRRLKLHRWDLARSRHHSILLQRAWDRHGEEAFVFEIVLLCDAHNLVMYEQCLIDFYVAANPAFGMNVAPFAGRPCIQWTDERRAKWSAARKGQSGFKHKPDVYARFLATVKRGIDHPMFGKKHTPEALKKMSESKRGQPAWNKGLPSAKRGICRSPEVRARISEAKRAQQLGRLSTTDIAQITGEVAAGASQAAVARRFGVNKSHVSRLIKSQRAEAL